MAGDLKQSGHLDRVLISHDAGWYAVGEPGGGKYRGYETLFTEFLPALRKAGFSDADVEQLTVANPARAFTIGVRKG
jgi:phosphotriesterase-related protein